MVRFKNRWLLVEFLQPAQLAPGPAVSGKATLTPAPATWAAPGPSMDDEVDEDDDDEDESYPRASSSKLPFMLPLPTSGPSRPLLSGDSKTRQKNLSTYVRQSILETFGDDGHAKCSSLAVSYFSPATSLAIFRISRDHYRLAWAAINLVSELEGHRVVPRVIAVSGTLTKLCRRAKSYHRLVTGQMLCHDDADRRKGEQDKLEWAAEQAELAALEASGA